MVRPFARDCFANPKPQQLKSSILASGLFGGKFG
jgi:hypothetical protein